MAPAGPPPKAAADAKAKAKPKPKPKAKAEDAPKEDAEYIPKPDFDAMDAKMKAISEQIDGLKKKKQDLEDKMNSGKGVKDEFFKKKQEINAKIQGFKEKIDACHAEKDKFQQDVNEKKGEKSQLVADMKKARASIGYKSEEEMDKRMREIEYSLQTDTMPLKKEKELLKEMSELKKNRPKVAQVNKMGEELSNFDAGGSNVKETLQKISENIRTWMQAKAEVLEERKALEKEYEGKLGDQNVYEERNKLNEQIRAKMEERNGIRDAFREEEKKYKEAMWKKKQEQQERYAAEREARQKEYEERNRQRRAEKVDEQPFVMEITLIEQTMKFCTSLVSGREEKKEEEKKDIDHKNMDGLQVLGKKDERDEFWFEPTKGKKSKGSKPKGEKTGSSKPIKHNAETFQLFDKLKLDAPITLDDIPPTLEKLEAKLVVFQKKVAEWEVTREERKAKILAGGDVEDEKEDKPEPKEEKKDEKEEEAKAEEKEDE